LTVIFDSQNIPSGQSPSKRRADWPTKTVAYKFKRNPRPFARTKIAARSVSQHRLAPSLSHVGVDGHTAGDTQRSPYRAISTIGALDSSVALLYGQSTAQGNLAPSAMRQTSYRAPMQRGAKPSSRRQRRRRRLRRKQLQKNLQRNRRRPLWKKAPRRLRRNPQRRR